MFRLIAFAPLLLSFSQVWAGEIFNVTELSVRDVEALNRDNTVVIIPGGLFEEHGPYLPSFTDGYFNQKLADGVAESLARGGRDVLMFPIIPLGSGSPEDFGGLSPFPGSYTVRPETLRSIFMDLGTALGDDGFGTIFVLHLHGAPGHNRALLEAADYFTDQFGGQMVPLTALLYTGGRDEDQVFGSAALKENGLDIHAGARETSRILHLQPYLVHDDYQNATPFTASTPSDLTRIARSLDWLGYFGSPRLANAEKGEKLVNMRVAAMAELAKKVLNGFEWRQIPNRGDIENLPGPFNEADENYLTRFDKVRTRQKQWLESRAHPSNSAPKK